MDLFIIYNRIDVLGETTLTNVETTLSYYTVDPSDGRGVGQTSAWITVIMKSCLFGSAFAFCLRNVRQESKGKSK